jgi:hypothetical protein
MLTDTFAEGELTHTQISAHSRMLSVPALGMALSLFFVISYLICITTYFIPGLPISHAMLTNFLPGFELLNWRSFVLGLVESFAWGRYVALILGTLYNFFVIR